MTVIENSIFEQVKPAIPAPGTLLLDTVTFMEGKNVVKIALSIVWTKRGWSTPVFIMLLGVVVDKEVKWALNPWISEGCLNKISTLLSPKVLFSRISPEDSAMLADKAKKLWNLPE